MLDDIFLLITAVGFFVWTIRSLYKHVIFFQKLPHSFLYPKQNKARFIFSSLFSYSGVLSWVILAFSFYMTITDFSMIYLQAVITALFVLKMLAVVKEVRRKQLFTVFIYSRSLVLLLVSYLCITLLFFYPLTIHVIWILFLERITFFIALALLLVFGFPTELLDDVAVKKATRRMKSFKAATKILVLGGDNDEIAWVISQIVDSSKEAILPSSILTRGDLASRILSIKSSPEIIIVSINSQNTHLVKVALEIMQPNICVIAPRYSSQENNVLNIRSLSDSIDKRTKIILPIEYERPARLFLRKNSIFYYASEKNVSLHNGAYVEDVVYKRSGISFSLVLNAQTLHIQASAHDRDFIDFIVPATLVAKILHIPMKRIEAFSSKVSVPRSMFSIVRSKKRAVCIDGTGISSVEKIVREVEYLKVFGDAIIVIIGKLSPYTSKKELLVLGNALNEIAGNVILLHGEYLRPLRAGMKDRKGNSKIVCMTMAQAQKLARNVGKNEKILFIGTEAEPLLQVVQSES